MNKKMIINNDQIKLLMSSRFHDDTFVFTGSDTGYCHKIAEQLKSRGMVTLYSKDLIKSGNKKKLIKQWKLTQRGFLLTQQIKEIGTNVGKTKRP